MVGADVDLFEVNEAFSGIECVRRELDSPERSSRDGWGGRPRPSDRRFRRVRLLAPFSCASRGRSMKRGVASLCLGGGEAVALAIELV